MTVEQLIELLATYPPELRVVVNGYEEGFDDVAPDRVSITRIALDVGKHRWEGRHDTPGHRAAGRSASPVVDALVLWRTSN